MRLAPFLQLLALASAVVATNASTRGVYDLVKRRLPSHADDFIFTLTETNTTEPTNDEYSISTAYGGAIAIEGNSISALTTGLRRYFNDIAHADLHWFIGNRLDTAASPLPRPNATIVGKSIVPWRYYFNTVTFSYTSPFWTWEDWEYELDWLALRGVNLPLAWVGFEKILLDVFRETGLTDPEILTFFSGPAFLAWNRFGNIQGSWGGELPLAWIDSQFELQKKILKRMIELGMTPILPAFTGFVPRAIHDKFPDANVVNGSRWEGFDSRYTNTTFLEPSDPMFADLQARTIGKQLEYYGNITQFYTLDQYNENDPASGDLEYLRSVTAGTWKSLKAANPGAVWVMQGWLFYSNRDFWDTDRISAYLSGVEVDSDILILDLFSESEPQWQRTDSYYGKPWVWCQLHDYGGNQGLYGQIDNVTINPISALQTSPSMVGMGLTPEGEEGNEIIYSLLLDQAWSSTPIDTASYFTSFVRTRYNGPNNTIPSSLYTAWEILRTTAYNNTNLTANAVPKSILELHPHVSGLVDRSGHHPTALHYDPTLLVTALTHFLSASSTDEALWQNPAYQHDIVDLARQVLANTFLSTYTSLLTVWNTTSPSPSTISTHSEILTSLLTTLDALLSTLPHFRLSTWLAAARASAPAGDEEVADFFEYTARNQLTLWGPEGEINDYASKQWGGLVGGYYLPRWEVFLEYVAGHGPGEYDQEDVVRGVGVVQEGFQRVGGAGIGMGDGEGRSVREVVEGGVVQVLGRAGVL
ncbi:glycoside hydrolase family 89 protein [Aaosphaeria arxii CBS 175.79]|uniref:Glycoside hydrolase family 89 protein n=1 Tax=Aaosphaeria arxii CBS 175.79 TaxID=1450172 RepID=A0A6A5Y375_9PLEO|nr:glycoside hydrolase family 89 protein [Aaosphaeria arxii CBS 175.79]KAF2019260.1 glycoside hydrolase family 89 protein [Aaosphaeria arxii CBS 175.79]